MGTPYNQGRQPGNYQDMNGNLPYSTEDYVRDTGNRSYSLPVHEKKNITQIKERLDVATKNELQAYVNYLDNLLKDLKQIIQKEQGEGISNIMLENEIRKIGILIGEVLTALDRF